MNLLSPRAFSEPMKTLRFFSTVLATASGLLAVLGAPAALAAPGDLLPLAELNYGLPGAHFGTAAAAVGSDRFVVSAPNFNYTPHLGQTVTNCGIAYLYDLNTNLVNTISNPDPRKDDYFGWTLA